MIVIILTSLLSKDYEAPQIRVFGAMADKGWHLSSVLSLSTGHGHLNLPC